MIIPLWNFVEFCRKLHKGIFLYEIAILWFVRYTGYVERCMKRACIAYLYRQGGNNV